MIIKYGLLLLAYLIGAIPFSVIFGRLFKGIDVRNHGSGNPGGTNSLRYLGYKVGALIIFFDMSKGALIIILIRLGLFDNYEILHPLAYGFASAFGHSYSVFIKFKGGKAVGTTAGAMSAFNPLLSLASSAFFFLGLKITKYVSLGSTAYGIGLVIIALVIQDYNMLFYVILSCMLIIFRHQSNYRNIKNKVEPKISWI